MEAVTGASVLKLVLSQMEVELLSHFLLLFAKLLISFVLLLW